MSRTAFDFHGYLLGLKRNRNEGWNENYYPFNLPIASYIEDFDFHENVTFLVGENGSGKSTLIEAIAIAAGFNAEGGTKNFNFQTTSAHSKLHDHITLIRAPLREKDGFFLRAESFFNVASQIDNVGANKSYGNISLHEVSHGESFLELVTKRFRKDSLFILDEPEAALSPARQLSFLTRIHDLVRQNCQFIIATHSPILMAYPDAWIYELKEDGPLRAEWENVEHVDTTRQFLKHPDSFLRILLEDGPDV